MSIRIRELQKKDRSGLELLLSSIPSFDLEDKSVALELIDTALNNPDQIDYLFKLAVEEDRPLGYACYGPTPLTDGTYDLYWIAVDHELSGRGIGTLLLKAVEEDIQKRNGRLLLIETSSSASYEKTRQFYLKNDYPLAETILDFYRRGEHRVTFVKRLIN
jgi:GNAT superfamily N-acetyltransferase